MSREPLNVEAAFITSAASSRDFPDDGLPEIGLVGRSNVGKSSLINALVRQRIARTSSAPGKTRLANIYRVRRGGAPPLYLVDLPGYGFARGGSTGFEALVAAYFGRPFRDTPQQRDGSGNEPPEGSDPVGRAALLLVDARHPGLERDRAAWTWILERSGAAAVVATKIDKLSRAERQRASRELDAVFELPVLPVSAVTGEGLDELWILIDRLANNSSSRRNPPRSPRPPRATAPPPRPKRSSASTSRR